MKEYDQTFQEKYSHLEVNVATLNYVKEYFLLGSEFNGDKRKRALQALQSDSEYKVSDYFALRTTTCAFVDGPKYVYDLTHSLGNFLMDIEFSSENLGSSKKEIFMGDFIISRLRSYLQEMAVVPHKNFRQFASTEYFVYQPNSTRITANTLMVFALTNLVQIILNNSQYGTEHPRFYEFVFDNLPIPNVVFELNDQIDSMMNNAYSLMESSKALYKEAEDLLYRELGLNSNNPLQSLLEQRKDSNISIRTFKESFLQTGRLDAEYYQEKYNKNEEIIKSKNIAKLGDLVEIKKSIEPGSEAYKTRGVPFIRVSNLSKLGISQSEVFLDENTDFISLYPKKNEILLSKDGSVGISYCMECDRKVVLSGAILRLEILERQKVLPQFLTLVLNSLTTKLQAQRDSGGSIIEHWRIEQIKNISIPLLDIAIQQNIESKITQSFELQKKSKDLLETAKKKVEHAINKS